MKFHRFTGLALMAGLLWGGAVGIGHAAVIQSATTTLGGAAIDFEGFAEGTTITTQYAGVTFGQTDGGTPMIDNAPYIYGYAAHSGVGVLTGSINGGAPYPTVAGLRIGLDIAGSAIEFWLTDTAPLGEYTINAFNASDSLLASSVVDPQAFVGFSGLSGLSYLTVDSSVENDAFAIDDVRFSTVPEPATLALFGIGLAGLGFSRRRKRV